MDSEVKRRQVTVEQLHSLLQFLREQPALARGLSRGRRGKLTAVQLWATCAEQLNAMPEGAVKDGKGWSKYWCDWKYRVRRHALEIRVARDTNKVPPEGIPPMSPIEETIMAIIGDSSIEDVVVKSDPLVDEDSNEDGEQETNDNVETNDRVQETRKKFLKRPRLAAVDVTNEESDNDDEPGSPAAQRARTDDDDDDDEDTDSEEDNTTQFLRLEKMQLKNAKRIQASICQISLEIIKLTDIMGEIRDVLVKRLDHLT